MKNFIIIFTGLCVSYAAQANSVFLKTNAGDIKYSTLSSVLSSNLNAQVKVIDMRSTFSDKFYNFSSYAQVKVIDMRSTFSDKFYNFSSYAANHTDIKPDQMYTVQLLINNFHRVKCSLKLSPLEQEAHVKLCQSETAIVMFTESIKFSKLNLKESPRLARQVFIEESDARDGYELTEKEAPTSK